MRRSGRVCPTASDVQFQIGEYSGSRRPGRWGKSTDPPAERYILFARSLGEERLSGKREGEQTAATPAILRGFIAMTPSATHTELAICVTVLQRAEAARS